MMKKLKCVLLIDDDEITNFINISIIKDMNISDAVLVAQNGQEGIDTIKNQYSKEGCCPELILLDINMPGMNGFDFLDAYEKIGLESFNNTTVVVMLTTSRDPADMKKSEHYNIVDYIDKPLQKAKLQTILDKCFRTGG